MAKLATGARLASTVCNGQFMVVKAPDADLNLTCGGAALVDAKAAPPTKGAIDPAHKTGTAIGKRYVDSTGDLELLCVKAGEGNLALAGTALAEKGAKKLPSSD